MQLFDKNGYFNAAAAFDCEAPFVFVIGGRGTGKTYGCIKELFIRDEKFVFMRRTQTQLDTITQTELSPFSPVARDLEIPFEIKSINKHFSGVFCGNSAKMSGIMCALSTISNLRGFDASEMNIGLFDEFIAEPHEKPIKNEGLAFLNAYETINRNRELQGRKPFKMICLANSFNISNPIFEELGLINEIDRLRRKGKSVILNAERGLAVFMLNNSPISDAKRHTALYRLTENRGEFSDMALSNDFSFNEFDGLGSYQLQQLQPVCMVNGICIYSVKGTDCFYITRHKTGAITDLGNGERAEMRFRTVYLSSIWIPYTEAKVTFSDLETKTAFRKII